MKKLLMCLTLVLVMLLSTACSTNVRQEGDTQAPSETIDKVTAAADEIIASAGVDAVEVEVGEIESGRYGSSARITAQVPNYTELFTAAFEEDDPTGALAKAIENREYTTVEYKGYASVTMDGDNQIVHSDELVKSFIEKELIKAINAVLESEAAK